MTRTYSFTISYGKFRVPLYRVYAKPLANIPPIPESTFIGRSNILFSLEVDVEVFGDNFLPAYMVGDNSNVVATDSMKNFILRQGLYYEDATFEGLLDMLGRRFLETYTQMERLRLTARQLSFQPVTLPPSQEKDARESNVLLSRSHDTFSLVSMDFVREADAILIAAHRCGQIALELFKITGSSFTNFVRDEYTTLPERVDRPLFIYMDVYWTYNDISTVLTPDLPGYVPAEQIRDLIQVVFDDFVSESIQHLVYEMGRRLLDRFPQLSSVTFEARNLTRDLVVASPDDPRVKVYTDPFTAFGDIKLTINAEDSL